MSETASQTGPQSVPRGSRAVRNVLSNWTGYIVSVGITFFLSPFIVHHLGDSAYGVWVLLVSLTGYLGLLDLGVRGAVTRYVARFHTQTRHEDSSRIVSSALGIFVIAGMIAIFFSVVLAAFALRIFHIPPAHQFAAGVVLPLVGITVALSLTGSVFGGIVAGLQRFDLVNGIEIAISILRALATVLVLDAGKGIIALAAIQLGFAALRGLVYVYFSLRLYPELRVSLRLVNRQHLHMIFSFSLYSFMLQVSAYLILYTDAVVIGAFLPVSLVTFFSIAGNLVTYARGLTNGITTTMTPMASQLEASGKHSELQWVTLKGARYASALMLPIGVTFMLRGSTFIGLWMGPKYASLSGTVLLVLAIAYVMSAGPA